jgi:hypothetical protein
MIGARRVGELGPLKPKSYQAIDIVGKLETLVPPPIRLRLSLKPSHGTGVPYEGRETALQSPR